MKPLTIISSEDINKRKGELRMHATGWAKMVTEEMNKKLAESSKIKYQKVQNIVAHIITDNVWRVRFMAASEIVLKRLEREASKAVPKKAAQAV